MKVLHVAPHPDDETDAAGGTLAKLSRSHDVFVVYLTDGREGSPNPEERGVQLAVRRRREALEALRVLGIRPENAFFLDYPDQRLRFYARKASERLAELLKAIWPDLLIYPASFDAHVDHHAGARVAKLAVKKAGLRANELSYLVWPPEPSRHPARYRRYQAALGRRILVDVGEYKAIKLEAIKRHESQFKHFDAEFIRRFFETDYEVFYVERVVDRRVIELLTGRPWRR